MARAGRQGTFEIDADRGVRPYPAMDGLSDLGLGHRGWRPRAGLPQGLRLGDGAQRSHPPGDAEGRRQRHLPHRALDRVPAAGARHRALARADEGRRRQAARPARRGQHQLQARRSAPRHHRHPAAGLKRKFVMTSLAPRGLGIRFAIAAAISLCLSLSLGGARAEETTNVMIDNFTFEPAQLTVKVGTTVTWKNRDDIPHTVVSAGKFRSKTMDTDDSYSFTFTAAGDYKYFCSLHPHMTGTIKVE